MEICVSDYKDIERIRKYPGEELEPIYENCKSYYNKAKVYDVKGVKVLVSYNTPMVLYVGHDFF